MAANTVPRYTISGDISSNGDVTTSAEMAPTLTTAAADYTGATATHNKIVFTADSTNGSRLVGLHFEAMGSCTQSVARIFTNNGSANTTAANNSLIGKLTLPTVTASNTVAETCSDYTFPGGAIDLPPSARIVVGLATTVSAGWVVTPTVGGKF